MTNIEMKKPPNQAEHLGEFASNCHFEFDAKVAEALKGGGQADYPAWNWHGTVWFSDGQYHCMVMRYRVHVDTVSAPTPEALMHKVSDKWGYD